MKRWRIFLMTISLALVAVGSFLVNTGSVAHASTTGVQSSNDCSWYLIPTQGVGEVLPVVNNANPSVILYFQDFGGVFGVPEQISVGESTDGGQTQILLGAAQPPFWFGDIELADDANDIPYAFVCSNNWTVLPWQRG